MARRIVALLLAVMALFVFTASAADPDMAAAKKVKKIVLDQEGKIELKKGEKFTLTYTLKPEGAESKVTWTTSNKKVVKVNKKGVVTAKGEGTAKITVTTKNGKKDTVKIKVTDPTKAKKIIVDEDVKTVVVGEKFKPGYTLVPDTATNSVKITSSKPKVVKVNKKGEAVALKKGTAVLTFTTSNGKKDTMKVKVVKAGAPTPTPTAVPTVAPTATPEPSQMKAWINVYWLELTGIQPADVEGLDYLIEYESKTHGRPELLSTIGIAAEKAEDCIAAYHVVDPDYEVEKMLMKMAAGYVTNYVEASDPFSTNAVIVVSDKEPNGAPYTEMVKGDFTKPGTTPAPTATPAPTSAPAPGAENQVWFDIYWMEMGGMIDVKDIDTFIDALNNAPGFDFNMNGASDEIGIAAASYEYYYEAFKIIDPTYEKEKFNLIMAAGLVESMTESATPFAENAAIVVAPQVPSEYADRYYLLKDFY